MGVVFRDGDGMRIKIRKEEFERPDHEPLYSAATLVFKDKDIEVSFWADGAYHISIPGIPQLSNQGFIQDLLKGR